MNGSYLKFYVHEKRHVHHRPAYLWLLEKAKEMGIAGGCAYRTVAGYGHHGVMHEDHFFELQGDLPIEVSFALGDEQAERLLQALRDEKLALFYVRMAAQFGTLDSEAAGA